MRSKDPLFGGHLALCHIRRSRSWVHRRAIHDILDEGHVFMGVRAQVAELIESAEDLIVRGLFSGFLRGGQYAGVVKILKEE